MSDPIRETNMTFRELREELNDMSDEQLEQQITAFVLVGGLNTAAPVDLRYAEGDALLANGNPYFLI